MSLGARGQGRRRRLTWSAYPRRFLADVFKKFRHGRKDFSSGCSPRAGTDSRSEVAVGTKTQSPQKAARSAARAQQLGRHCPRLPPHRPEPHAAGSAAGRHPGALGLPPPGRAHVSLPTSSPPQPPRNGGGSALGPTLPLSFPTRARAKPGPAPGTLPPASAPAPLRDPARRQRSGVRLGKLSAEAGNNKRGARPRPPPPQPGPEPPGSAAPPAAAEGPGPYARRGPERRAPPGGRPAPPAAAARGVPAWREAHPGPLRGRGAGDRGAEGGESAPGPAERRTETPRSARNGGGRRTHRPGLSRCLLRPQNHNKALPKMAARPCPAGGRRGRGLRARGAGPGVGRDTPTWLRRRPRGAPPPSPAPAVPSGEKGARAPPRPTNQRRPGGLRGAANYYESQKAPRRAEPCRGAAWEPSSSAAPCARPRAQVEKIPTPGRVRTAPEPATLGPGAAGLSGGATAALRAVSF